MLEIGSCRGRRRRSGADGFPRGPQREEWRDAWFAAEAAEALAALEEALDAGDAWHRAPHTAQLELHTHSAATADAG